MAPLAPPAPQRLPRVARWGLWLFGLLLGLVVVLAIAVAVMDWNRARPWVNQKVSEATGRRFAIKGDLSVAWRWPRPLEEGWHRWVPGVAVTANHLVMDNPSDFKPPFADTHPGSRSAASKNAGADTPAAPATMARIDSATATVRLLPLLGRYLSIETIDLTGPDIALARTAHGDNNWTFQRQDGPPSGWTFDVDRLMVRQGVLGYADGMKDLDLRARIDTTEPTFDKRSAQAPAKAASTSTSAATPKASTASASKATTPHVAASFMTPATASAASASSTSPMPYGLRFELEGRYAKAKIKGSGRAGQVISLRNKMVNYPLQIAASAGSLALSAEGILANPGALSGLDFQVFLKGASMADLYDVTGLVLPSTPPFETDGQLTGSLTPERAVWQYNGFDGKVGQSDLHGSLKYTSGKPRPRLTGQMSSNQLRLSDLGPTVGTNNADNANRGQDKTGQRGKVLPDSKFAAERWNAMDMDIAFKGQHIIRPESLPLENLSLRAVMDNAQLKLAPLTFGVAQGKIESEVSIDGRSPPLKAQIHGKIQGLQLSELFPKVQLMKKSLGRMDGAIALESRGNSIAGLLGQGTGEARLYVRDGTLSKQMLDLAALNVGSIIVGKLFGDDKEVHLRCAVADFTVVDGLASTRIVKMSTDDAVVQATGTIDLGTEQMNLRIKPESLQWKFFSLRSPLYVKGTFGNPDVGVEVGPLLLRAGAAVAAAVAAPVALALVPVTVPAGDDDTHCKPLLTLAKEPVKPGSEGAAGTASQAARKAAKKATAPR
ncbi:AsmA family protein [Acidovorax radicis]|nr:AsmA family protein [Acidovorax radicis]